MLKVKECESCKKRREKLKKVYDNYKKNLYEFLNKSNVNIKTKNNNK